MSTSNGCTRSRLECPWSTDKPWAAFGRRKYRLIFWICEGGSYPYPSPEDRPIAAQRLTEFIDVFGNRSVHPHPCSRRRNPPPPFAALTTLVPPHTLPPRKAIPFPSPLPRPASVFLAFCRPTCISSLGLHLPLSLIFIFSFSWFLFFHFGFCLSFALFITYFAGRERQCKWASVFWSSRLGRTCGIDLTPPFSILFP